MNLKRVAVIVAGGKGERMGGNVPKQFLEVEGKMILMHTIEAFFNFDFLLEIVVVLPKQYHQFWKDACKKYAFEVPLRLVEGGETRFHSVKNGLATVEDGTVVSIHDGVRPFLSSKLIENAFVEAELNGSAIPVLPMVDSVRKFTDYGSAIVDRTSLLRVQTPQAFLSTRIKAAYEQPYCEVFTDDASVYEAMFGTLTLFRGDDTNIKITTSGDLVLSRALMALQKKQEF